MTSNKKDADSLSDSQSDKPLKDPQLDTNLGEPFNYDDILKHLGQLGKFQLWSFLWLGLPVLFPAFATYSYSFTNAVTDYRCYIDACDQEHNNTSDTFLQPWVNVTIPGWGSDDKESNSHLLLRQCYKYNETFTNEDECLNYNNTTKHHHQFQRCNKWVYDTSVFGSTLNDAFELTCENEWQMSLPGTIFMLGSVFGSFLSGLMSTKCGRKPTFLLFALVLAGSMTGSAFSTDLITFSVLRFFSGATSEPFYDVCYVWGVEAVGENYQISCGFTYLLLFTFGSALVGPIAYFVRDWRTLILILGVPMFTSIILIWTVPESIRWLVATKRYDEARRLILKAAKVNGKSVPDHLLVIPTEPKETNDTVENRSIIRTICCRVFLKRIFIMIAAWFAVFLGYFGITFAASHLAGNFYLNYELIILIQMPAIVCGIYVNNKWGRRPALGLSLFICGAACLINGFLPYEYEIVRIVFAMIGTIFISIGMSTIFSFTVELFPTSIRSISMGICSTCGRIGSVLAPILANGVSSPYLAFLVFGIINIVAGALCFLLPETKNLPLPSTVQEALDLEKKTLSLKCRS